MPVSGTTFRASLYYLPYVEGAPTPRSEDFVLALRPGYHKHPSHRGVRCWNAQYSRHDHAPRHCLVSSEGVGGSVWYEL